MGYFTRSKSFGSLVHKKTFGFLLEVVRRILIFFKRVRIILLSLKELGKISQATIIFGKFSKSRSAYIFAKFFPLARNWNTFT